MSTFSASEPQFPRVTAHLTSQLMPTECLPGSIAVVIDLLRASTTITTALASGAAAIYPCREVALAWQLAERFSRDDILLGGERQGTLIEGFDLDNSPAKYTRERVGGKTLLFTTTNGTAAIELARPADRVLIGCFANLNCLLDLLLRDGRPVRLICAGTNGQISTEDVLVAGALATGLLAELGSDFAADDQTTLALSLYQSAATEADKFWDLLKNSRGGRNLRAIGLESDIEIAARWDTHPLVAEYQPDDGSLRPAGDIDPDAPQRLKPPQ